MKSYLALFFSVILAVGATRAQETPDADFIPVDVEPTITSRVSPEYPREALSKDLEGLVWLKVFVSEKGLPSKVEVVKSTDPLFEQPAIDAAQQFRFTPAQIKNKPIAVWVSIPFKFKLTPKSDIIKKNSEELPKKIKNPAILIIEGPKSFEGKITYPTEALSKRIEGVVFANVTLDDQKRISGVTIVKGIGGGCNEEVLRAISEYKFYEDANPGIKTQGEQSIVSIVAQFILPAK